MLHRLALVAGHYLRVRQYDFVSIEVVQCNGRELYIFSSKVVRCGGWDGDCGEAGVALGKLSRFGIVN